MGLGKGPIRQWWRGCAETAKTTYCTVKLAGTTERQDGHPSENSDRLVWTVSLSSDAFICVDLLAFPPAGLENCHFSFKSWKPYNCDPDPLALFSNPQTNICDILKCTRKRLALSRAHWTWRFISVLPSSMKFLYFTGFCGIQDWFALLFSGTMIKSDEISEKLSFKSYSTSTISVYFFQEIWFSCLEALVKMV